MVGDQVRWQPTGDEGVIEHVEPRRNLLFRQDEWRTKSFAANLDQLLMLVAVEPMFSESQLTRALIAAAAAGIPALIVLNKIDLPQRRAARERLAPYRGDGRAGAGAGAEGRSPMPRTATAAAAARTAAPRWCWGPAAWARAR